MLAGTAPLRQQACAAAFRGADNTPALVLAAGASTRFGGSKALARYGDQMLLDRAIEQARRLSADVRVVTGCRGPLLRARAQSRPTFWLFAEDWSEGLSASLRTGVHTLPNAARGVFVVLVDQPELDAAGLDRLREVACREPHSALAADYNGRPGVPAYLPRWLWPAVCGLEGDRGAGRILKTVGAERLPIAGVTADVDTPEDLAKLRSSG